MRKNSKNLILFYLILLFVVFITVNHALAAERKQVHIKIAHVDEYLDYDIVKREDIENGLTRVLSGETRINDSHTGEDNVQYIESANGSWHLFTKKGHPAHPSHYALIKTEKAGKITRTSVRQTAGNEKNFKIWIRAVVARIIGRGDRETKFPFNEDVLESKSLNTEGESFYREGEFSKAEKYFHLSIEKNPQNLSALSNLSVTYIKQNKIEESIALSEKIIKYTITNDELRAASFYNLGKAYELRKNHFIALSCYYSANKIKKTYARKQTLERILKQIRASIENVRDRDSKHNKVIGKDLSFVQFVQSKTNSLVTIVPIHNKQLVLSSILFVYQQANGATYFEEQPLIIPEEANGPNMSNLTLYFDDWNFDGNQDILLPTFIGGRNSRSTILLRQKDGTYQTNTFLSGQNHLQKDDSRKVIKSFTAGSAYEGSTDEYIFYQNEYILNKAEYFINSIMKDSNNNEIIKYSSNTILLDRKKLEDGIHLYREYRELKLSNEAIAKVEIFEVAVTGIRPDYQKKPKKLGIVNYDKDNYFKNIKGKFDIYEWEDYILSKLSVDSKDQQN